MPAVDHLLATLVAALFAAPLAGTLIVRRRLRGPKAAPLSQGAARVLRTPTLDRPCPTCQARVGVLDTMCTVCGANLPARRLLCPRCGLAASAVTKFCKRCRTQLAG